MGSKSLTVNVVTIKPFRENMFEEFLGIDGDFSENEEYFREDTLALGFRSEAHRVSKELNAKFTKEWYSRKNTDDEQFEAFINECLEEACHVYAGDSQFILGNQSYTSDYVITTVSDFSDYDEEITVVISYIS